MNTATQTRILKDHYASNLATGVLATIESIHKNSKKLTYGVMLVSYAHQSAFLFKLFGPHFSANPFELLEAISLLIGALMIPGLFDLAIVMMIRIMSTVGMTPAARKLALRYLPAPVVMSATVNVLASHTIVIATVFVMVVSLIAVIEHLHSKVEPHFPTIEALELEAIADTKVEQIAAPKVDRKAQKRNADKARTVAAASPSLTAKQLADATGVSAGTARKILDEVRSAAPTSPGHGPVSAPPAAEMEEMLF